MSAPWAMKKTLPEDTSNRPAKKRIRSSDDVEKWKKSEAYSSLCTFLSQLSDAVRSKSNSQGKAERGGGDCVAAIVAALRKAASWIDEIPLEDLHTQRYGNKAFRKWHTRLCDAAAADIGAILAAGGGDAAKGEEIAIYWNDAFGNETRIDYGTGHELNFVVMLYCLSKLGCFEEGDAVALVTTVFVEYLAVMRRLQAHYSLEPAGSKGVWGLDDYHHLPFYWGASQLLDNPSISPADVEKVCHDHASEFLYLDCVSWILRNKTGAFHENSPILSSLSSLQWPKINKGMMQMYIGEVLAQWPVVQHLCFGTLFPFG
eukprot:TRINITY_DN31694_c0_g1_i1.p1 TRINITY_DN31694_c0_g1~~TRINITY_DN31694_c0_g1_i1.p1  ORF type:complete len:316 (+),score=143.00 TRINITY_DN31694_c0_g1_i1:67-1014(+)